MKQYFTGICLILISFCMAPTAGAVSNSTYAFAPPYVTTAVKPNINIVLDYSGSMQFPAYQNCSFTTYNSYKAALCGVSTNQAYAYSSAKTYYGYFKNNVYYNYDTANGNFAENSAACTAYSGQQAGGAGCISGNLLNWVFTTRADALRKALTGGRLYSTTTDTYLSDGATFEFTDNTLQCDFDVNATNSYARQLTISNQSSTKPCVLGTLSNANARVKTSTPSDITGLVQTIYPGQVDLELSVFNATVKTKYRVGKNDTIAKYVSAINTEQAYDGTPTGEALDEAKSFFKQDSSTIDYTNSTMVNRGNGLYDPYYDYNATTSTSVAVPCRNSFVLLISDGDWNGTINPAVPANTMWTTDLRTDTGFTATTQRVSTYALYVFGDGTGKGSMVATAIFGGYTDNDKNGFPYPFTAAPTNSTVYTFPITQCQANPPGPWNSSCAEWDSNGNGLPDNYFEASDGAAIEVALKNAIISIFGKVSAGTAASILGNNDNSGSSLMQAMFYPNKTFQTNATNSVQVTWTGEIQTFWYYLDPYLNNVTIREDTVADKKLILANDRIVEYFFDTSTLVTSINLFTDTNGDGVKDSVTPVLSVAPDKSNALWRAGEQLFCRNESDRTIFTNNPTASTATKLNFAYDTSTATTLQPYLDVSTVSNAQDIIKYTRGIDVSSSYRNRTVPVQTAACTGLLTTNTRVWKLGDIINSTPKVQSEVFINSYHKQAPYGYADTTYSKFVSSKDYNTRGTMFAGGNDGMLHAFNTGSNSIGSVVGEVAEIKEHDGTTIGTTVFDYLGRETWAFVPKNALPYLKYITSPAYSHIFTVDATPLLVDASINQTKYFDGTSIVTCNPSKYLATDTDAYSSCIRATTIDSTTKQLKYDITGTPGTGETLGTSWRTILIGGSGLGGASSSSQIVTTGASITVNASAKTLTRSSGSFLTDGWAVGKIFAAFRFGNAANNIPYKITGVTATVITCSGATGLVSEGPTVADLQEVNVPAPLSALGYSTFFAMDVTSPLTNDLASGTYPKLLWEFTDPGLGFTSVTPVVIRIKDASDNGNPGRNGKWYAILASGPTGPIYGNTFWGYSNQPLKIFVLDLATGTLLKTFSSDTDLPSTSQFTNAFGGSLSNASLDTERRNSTLVGTYSDDAVYIGYTRADSTTATMNKGGVLRLLTNNDPNPANWKLSTVVDGIGPVTSAVTKLQDTTNHMLWLYFGTGRYFSKGDDPSNIQSLYGIKDPCYDATDKFILNCTTTVTASSSATGAAGSGLVNQTSSIGTVASTAAGWFINLNAAGTGTLAKRVITDPVASSNGFVFFTTLTPITDVCSFGGTTTVWSVNYATGGVGVANLQGQLLMQLSTGAFQQVDLATAFSKSLNRESSDYQGVPPKAPPSLISNASHKPSKRVLHIQEH